MYQTLPEASIQRKTCILGLQTILDYKRCHFVLYRLRVCAHPYILAHKMAQVSSLLSQLLASYPGAKGAGQQGKKKRLVSTAYA